MVEEPVVEKTARVVEVVAVGKEASKRTENIEEKVRHTEVDRENLPDQSANVTPRKPTCKAS